MNIFALKGDEIQIFHVNMNEKLIKAIQSKIDKWNGKGKIKEFQGVVLMGHTDLDKKIEVVSSTYVGQGDVFYSCCPEVETMDIYNYKFYQYTPHPLSKLCDSLLSDYESLEFSEHLAKLLNWTSDNDNEMVFVNKLISAFKFKKVSVDEIVQSDLTIEEKRNVLAKIISTIRNISKSRKTVVSPKLFDDEVERKISDMEAFYSGFCARELHGTDFEYTSKQKKEVKRKILSKLPTSDSIMKISK